MNAAWADHVESPQAYFSRRLLLDITEGRCLDFDQLQVKYPKLNLRSILTRLPCEPDFVLFQLLNERMQVRYWLLSVDVWMYVLQPDILKASCEALVAYLSRYITLVGNISSNLK